MVNYIFFLNINPNRFPTSDITKKTATYTKPRKPYVKSTTGINNTAQIIESIMLKP